MTDASDPKFLADENVGKLGRWLRILGYDVAYQSPALDAQLALKALRENRVILTRDREFVERRMVERHLLLTSQDPIEQLKQVIQTFHLKLDRDSFFTRCLDCNPYSVCSQSGGALCCPGLRLSHTGSISPMSDL